MVGSPVSPPSSEASASPKARAERTGDWLTLESLRLLAMLADLLVMLATGLLSAVGQTEPTAAAAWALALGSLAGVQLLWLAGAYDPAVLLDLPRRLTRTALCWPLVTGMLGLLALIGGPESAVPGLWLGLWTVLGGLGLAAAQGLGSNLLGGWQRAGRLGRNVVVVGAGEQGQRLVEHIRRHDRSLRLIGLFDDRRDRVPDFVAGYPVLGTIDDLQAFSREHRVDEVLVALPWGAEGRLLDCLDRLRSLPADVRLCSDMIGFHMPDRGVAYVAGVPALQVFQRPLSGPALLLKTIEDRLLAAGALLFLAPAMLVTALAVRLTSPGPVLSRDPCWGLNHESFAMLRFRTTLATGPEGGEAPLTALGSFLRRASVDDLPQLLNVLRGEMSLVGPRPHRVAQNERYQRLIDRYPARHRVKPGMTGLAQVNGHRGEVENLDQMQRRVEEDLRYVQSWTLGLDLKIILLTLLRGLTGPARRASQ